MAKTKQNNPQKTSGDLNFNFSVLTFLQVFFEMDGGFMKRNSDLGL